MIKRFDTTVNPILSSVIDTIEASLQCSRFRRLTNMIKICTPDSMMFISSENKQISEKGFGACVTNGQGLSIVIDMNNCTTADLTEREIAAVVYHELGHILNVPELDEEPSFFECFNSRLEFNMEPLDNVRNLNEIKLEVYADSYANRHGYGIELISTFHKQNEHFEQQIGYCATRIDRIRNNDFLEGKIMPGL